ncbi:hypothetical protein [Paenibacillus chitinolyticus]|uniref:hypothetical protein n=1 Tax=Paenibacillus chitinolyticus TaxID=79263 RepID=UPI001C495ED0|nr:hypothetical protein [Paenibacillus chitinolyticus]MBV6715568.1 hypothetical protein [Paenibacillus chitinolyticus]
MYEFVFSSSKFTHPVFVTAEKGANKVLKVDASDLKDGIEDMAQLTKKLESSRANQLLTEAKKHAKQLLQLDLTG